MAYSNNVKALAIVNYIIANASLSNNVFSIEKLEEIFNTKLFVGEDLLYEEVSEVGKLVGDLLAERDEVEYVEIDDYMGTLTVPIRSIYCVDLYGNEVIW